MKGSGIAFVGNRFVALPRAQIPVTDLAVQRGIGLFESLRTYNREPHALVPRVKRLLSSAALLGLKVGGDITSQYIEKMVRIGLRKARYKECLVKIIITGGDGEGLRIVEPSRLIVIFTPLHHWPRSYYERGVRLKTIKLAREFTHIKSLSYLIPVLADMEARRMGFEEALFRDEQNNLLEGTQFNFAIVEGQKIITPNENVLPGITMDIVLELAKKMGLTVQRRKIVRTELKRADESFITSATREVIPVVKIDQTKIATGKPGPITSALLKKYRENARNQNSSEKK